MKKDIVLDERIDRNGTKHQLVETNCWRCGGAGGHEMWRYTGFTCFKCGGSGRMTEKRKIYTPEHAEKLRIQREKRAEKKRQERIAQAQEKNKEWLEKWGYNNKKIYLVLGDTFPIKDELKEKGARYNGFVGGWFFTEKPEEFDVVELKTSELIWFNDLGEVNQKTWRDCKDYINGERKKVEQQSEWIGEVGEKIEMEVTLLFSFEFDTDYGWSCINTMMDEQGNKFVWKTSKDLCYMHGQGNKIKIKGTVKEHSEYKDEHQTVLTRCKLVS
jgi:hypothetical protein